MVRTTVFVIGLMFTSAVADAQVLGTFRWQLQPYCNIVSLPVTNNGGVFELEGTDDQCGALQVASAIGTAFFNPDGSIGFGLAIVTSPGGTPVHVDASISVSTLSGTWHDSTGATGPFVFTPGAGTGGNPRPASTLGLSGVSLGFGLAASGSPGNVAVHVDLGQVRSSLDIHALGFNLAIGADTFLSGDINGSNNTAFGVRALQSLTVGDNNTAMGFEALKSAASGSFNVAIGLRAMRANTTGNHNVAVGTFALNRNINGFDNVAVGDNALFSVMTGRRNAALGDRAGTGATGDDNLIVGAGANVFGAGSRNVIIGAEARGSGEGSDNIIIGFRAGQVFGAGSTASNNIYIGSEGFGPDNNTIRIGNNTHVGTVIKGIAGRTAAGGIPVLINAGGRMGTTTSSIRFKTDVAPIRDDEMRKLLELRPVRFVYKPEYDDGARQTQYGLIAEDVAETFPELLVRDDDGRPFTVRYHLLAPLLLAEIQRLQKERAALSERVDRQELRLGELERQLATALAALEAKR